MMRSIHGSLSLPAIAAIAVPAWGHHSHGNYQMNEYTHLEGTVQELLWMNPHTWIYLEVPGADGQSTVWALEGGNPGSLTRRGWSRDSVQVGDKISVRCHRLRDGSNGCLLGFVTPEDGVEKQWD
jgi:hypothetical protein